MDIAHHTLIGGVGYMAITGGSHEPLMVAAGSAFVAGSVLPDLDVFLMVFGKRFYLRHHQGLTHSLMLSPLLALLISLPIAYALGLKLSWVIPAAGPCVGHNHRLLRPYILCRYQAGGIPLYTGPCALSLFQAYHA
jgi:membrane-bound metal-dependent hydrolase YbcI (DUF457 family)